MLWIIKNLLLFLKNLPLLKKINYTLAILTLRKIDNGNAIKFKNKYYQPYLNNELKCFMPKTECLVINAYNGDLLVAIDEKIYELRELNRNAKYSLNFESIPITKEKKKYIPLMSHPWRTTNFKKQLQKAHYQHRFTKHSIHST